MLQAERQAGERIGRLEQAIREAVPNWSLSAIVPALMAMRGIDLVAAVTILAEIGDLSRFESPRKLMAYLGLVPSERSTGDSVKRGGITKAGNGRARRVLVEAAWAYTYAVACRPTGAMVDDGTLFRLGPNTFRSMCMARRATRPHREAPRPRERQHQRPLLPSLDTYV